jgi:3-oxoadipate enol-lactonase
VAWVERAAVRFYVERAGSGPVLLYISGTGADLRVHPTAFDLPFASRFDLVTYDQRGLGQTDQPPGPYTMAGYADDAATILDAVGVGQAIVMGVSFGGMVAQELVLRYPAKVSRLVLASTSSGGAGGSSYPLRELLHFPKAEHAAVRLALTDSRWEDDTFIDPVRDSTARGFAASGPPTPGARLQLEARRHHDTHGRLGAIECPVLVCAGRYDKIAPPSNAAALASAIPDARLELFEGGHRFTQQDPRAPEVIVSILLN